MATVDCRRAILGLAALGLVGCGGTSSGGVGGDECDGGTECAPWTIEMAPGTGATFALETGALVLRRPGPTGTTSSDGPFNGDDVALSQSGLNGAFDVNVEWEALQTGGGVWSKVEAGIWWNDPVSGYVTQATGSVGGFGGQAVIINNPQFLIQSLNGPVTPAALDGASGSFHVVKTATGSALVTTTVNGQSTTAQSTMPFPDQTYTLFIGIGIGAISSDSDLHNEESIRITRVTVRGGRCTVRSDEFACAALPQP